MFNGAYEDFPAWNGFAASLEQHNAGAITFGDNAMSQNVPELVRELSAVPEYRDRFRKVFGGEISFTNVIRALAAFERSLLTFDSAFDRFQAGDRSQLTKEQQEGLALFMGKAGCSSCHAPPLFTDNRFHALGAFRTPTLRNVALTAPYMHDGVFGALDEVIAFYDAGGGPVPASEDSDRDATAVRRSSFGRCQRLVPVFLSAQDAPGRCGRKGRCGPQLAPHLTGSAGTPRRCVSSLGLRPSLASSTEPGCCLAGINPVHPDPLEGGTP